VNVQMNDGEFPMDLPSLSVCGTTRGEHSERCEHCQGCLATVCARTKDISEANSPIRVHSRVRARGTERRGLQQNSLDSSGICSIVSTDGDVTERNARR
jgi:hypothetical protein